MLKVSIIGIGNTGNQVAALANQTYAIPVIAINSSEKDLETIGSNIPKKLISSAEGSQGAGKDRTLAKKYLKETCMSLLTDTEMVSMISDSDIVFIISSTGGGTGSGTAPLMYDIITKTYPNVKAILIGVTPVNDDALSAHVNSLEYLNELYKVLDGATYMLYDNDKLSGKPSYTILETVNKEIVEDINVLRCYYNYSTRYDSIDDRDATRILSYPGRIAVARIEDIHEKDCDNTSIEDMIISNIKKNCHVELQRDNKIMASGIITNLSQALTESFDNNVSKVRAFIGTPVHSFNHISVNADRKQPNNVFYIMSGLSQVHDKINKINDRVEEIEAAQKVLEEDDALAGSNLTELTSKIADKKTEVTASQVDISGIFGKFNI